MLMRRGATCNARYKFAEALEQELYKKGFDRTEIVNMSPRGSFTIIHHRLVDDTTLDLIQRLTEEHLSPYGITPLVKRFASKVADNYGSYVEILLKEDFVAKFDGQGHSLDMA
jgi:hypothetical protein